MKYDIYFHNDFDGRAAAAVVRAFLLSHGDDIEHYVPVKYDLIPQWLDENFLEKHTLFRDGRRDRHNLAIIVDFPYHPQAAFWFDHHIRPFRKPIWEKKFKPDRQHRFDDSYRSACHLAYNSLREGFGWKPPAHLRELVKWLDIIDFANYKSARQTIEMKEAAIQVNAFIENRGDDFAMTVAAVKLLSEKPLADFLKIPYVRQEIIKLRRDMAKSIQFLKENIKINGRVLFADFTNDPTDNLAYFAPHLLYPKQLYMIRFSPHHKGSPLIHINVGTNPWRRAENKKDIGSMLKNYGGGGHKNVGGVEIKGRAAALRAVEEMTEFLNKK
jgi:hypothetical protein